MDFVLSDEEFVTLSTVYVACLELNFLYQHLRVCRHDEIQITQNFYCFIKSALSPSRLGHISVSAKVAEKPQIFPTSLISCT